MLYMAHNDSRVNPDFYRNAWNVVAKYRWEFCLSLCRSVRASNACTV